MGMTSGHSAPALQLSSQSAARLMDRSFSELHYAFIPPTKSPQQHLHRELQWIRCFHFYSDLPSGRAIHLRVGDLHPLLNHAFLGAHNMTARPWQFILSTEKLGATPLPTRRQTAG
jgi:hypothetical protein